MLQKLNLDYILFLDIETVPEQEHFGNLEADKKELWEQKSRYQRKDEFTAEEFYERAGIWAEFGKIVCISVGLVVDTGKDGKLGVRLKSFQGYDEGKILNDFAELMNQYFHNISTHYMCGHNLREFDVPYICRRMVVNGIELPKMLQLHGKKPWETKYLLDTMDMWKFGDYKHYSSLKLLTGIFGIPSPKDDIDGSEVGKVFWEEKDVDRIAAYCEKDVLAVIQIMMKFKRMDTFEASDVTSLLIEIEE